MSFDPNTGLPINATSAAAQQPTTMQQQPGVVAVPVSGLRIERRLAVVSRRGSVLSPAAHAFSQRLLSLQS